MLSNCELYKNYDVCVWKVGVSSFKPDLTKSWEQTGEEEISFVLILCSYLINFYSKLIITTNNKKSEVKIFIMFKKKNTKI